MTYTCIHTLTFNMIQSTNSSHLRACTHNINICTYRCSQSLKSFQYNPTSALIRVNCTFTSYSEFSVSTTDTNAIWPFILNQYNYVLYLSTSYYMLVCISGVARPGPTRACALPSTFQALPSRASKGHVIL